MFFLFGWGHRTVKDYGPRGHQECSNCHNAGAWHLCHVREWFTLFFIPVIPYSSGHYLTCKICGASVKLGPEEAARLKGPVTY